MQTAIEIEVTEFLGRERYATASGPGRAAVMVIAPRPSRRPPAPSPSNDRSSGAPTRPSLPRLLGIGACRANALESLVIAGFVRGPSVRDVEDTLADALGPEATLSKSTVSRVCEVISPALSISRRSEGA